MANKIAEPSAHDTLGQATVLCPACGTQDQHPRLFQFESGRGLTPWARCASCDTYFMTSSYDSTAETDHSRHMAWGNEDEGAALNQRKRDGFISTLDGI